MAYPSHFQRIRTLIGQDRVLAMLLPEARRLRELDGRLAKVLPRALAQSCRVAAVLDGEAQVMCGNGAVAARLRGQAARIAAALGVERIKVRMRADWASPPAREKPGLSRQALAAWDALERELPTGELKGAIDRLLDHHRRGR